MTLRRRAALAAVIAVVAFGLGLVTDAAAARAASAPVGGSHIANQGTRAVAANPSHAERRAQLERGGWLPASGGSASGWVCVISTAAVGAAGADVPACTRSRAPPT
jgi:hypothetical protein